LRTVRSDPLGGRGAIAAVAQQFKDDNDNASVTTSASTSATASTSIVSSGPKPANESTVVLRFRYGQNYAHMHTAKVSLQATVGQAVAEVASRLSARHLHTGPMALCLSMDGEALEDRFKIASCRFKNLEVVFLRRKSMASVIREQLGAKLLRCEDIVERVLTPQTAAAAAPAVDAASDDKPPLIGSSGLATVHRMHWKTGRIDVAVKVLQASSDDDPKLLDTFLHEAQMLADLAHPRIVHLIGVVVDSARLLIVMPLFDVSLFERLRSEQTLAWSERARLCAEVAEGLQYLHSLENPVLHRDLKSTNVMLTRSCKVKLVDFGFAQVRTLVAGVQQQQVASSTPSSSLSLSSMPMSWQWRAPETLCERPSFSTASDVFALGVLAWEVASCQTPYVGQDASTMIACVRAGKRPLQPQAAPREFAQLIERCWAHEPADRPSASDASFGFESLVRTLSNQMPISRATAALGLGDGAHDAGALIDASELQFVDVLGNGSFGLVRSALLHGRKVAVKQVLHRNVGLGDDGERLHQRALLAMHREIVRMSALPFHEFVVQIHGAAWLADGTELAAVVEFCENGALADALYGPKRRVWALSDLLRVAHETACAVRHLHTHGMVHRDIAARNVLLARGDVVKVGDFGLARELSDDGGASFGSSSFAGSVRHMAPEQFAESRVFSFASDMFSFGVLLWEIFVQECPWVGVSVYLLAQQVVDGRRMTIPPTVPREISALMEQCWLADPGARPTVIDAQARLAQQQRDLVKSSQSPSQPPQPLSKRYDSVPTQDLYISMRELNEGF
jgi:serine/threonine protein kinase